MRCQLGHAPENQQPVSKPSAKCVASTHGQGGAKTQIGRTENAKMQLIREKRGYTTKKAFKMVQICFSGAGESLCFQGRKCKNFCQERAEKCNIKPLQKNMQKIILQPQQKMQNGPKCKQNAFAYLPPPSWSWFPNPDKSAKSIRSRIRTTLPLACHGGERQYSHFSNVSDRWVSRNHRKMSPCPWAFWKVHVSEASGR